MAKPSIQVTNEQGTPLTAYQHLVADIIKSGLEVHRASYARSPCGRWWMGLVGLDPEYVFKTWYEREIGPPAPEYIPLEECPKCKRR